MSDEIYNNIDSTSSSEDEVLTKLEIKNQHTPPFAIDLRNVPGLFAKPRPYFGLPIPEQASICEHKVPGFGKYPVHNRYIVEKWLGEGTYGKVYCALDIIANREVALKIQRDCLAETSGVPICALREVQTMSQLTAQNNCTHLLKLIDVFMEHGQLHTIMERMHGDLNMILYEEAVSLSESDVKSIAQQSALGLAALHASSILHRDLCPANIFINRETGYVKLGDFGFARSYGSLPVEDSMTPTCCTLRYRAPELLLGATQYAASIDTWSWGCILAELVKKAPVFPESTHEDVLTEILKSLHSQIADVNRCWDRMLPHRRKYAALFSANVISEGEDLSHQLLQSKICSTRAVELISSTIVLNPGKRLTAEQILKHDFFDSNPRATLPKQLPFVFNN